MRTAEERTPAPATRHSTPFFERNASQHFFGTSPEPDSFFQKSSPSPFIQPKLTIGQPNDKYEQEADAVAQKVVSSSQPTIQTKCAGCEKEERLQKQSVPGEEELQMQPIEEEEDILQTQSMDEEEDLQMKPSLQLNNDETAANRTEASPWIQSRINSSRGRGHPLDNKARGFMENRMQTDFSRVNIHTGDEAVQMNRELGARAFTVGSDIYFNKGEYRPETTKGKKLLAHELTHTVQQGHGISPKIQRLGDLSKVPPMACDVASSSPAGSPAIDSLFLTSSTSLSAAQKADIATFVLSWQAAGGTDALRVDGFASTPGTDEMNWSLSCERALSVANELHINGVPNNLIEIFAQGETSEFGAQGNNQRANVLIKATPPTPSITSETVAISPGTRTRTTIGVGEDVILTHSSGNAATTWTTSAGTLSATTGAAVLFTAPDTSQNVTITADGASIVFRILAPNAIHMDNVGGTVKHHQNFPDSGILTDVFLLPDTVNFNNVTYRELDAPAIATGAYSCHLGAEHCGPAGFVPCGDKAVTNTVVAGKGTKSVLGDCVYSGHCGGIPPFTPGILMFLIPYQYKVGSGSFRNFTIAVHRNELEADASTLTTSKAGASGSTTVGAPTALIGVCP